MARILFLIPHPDDETVAASATIARKRLVGDKLFGLYLTSGVPDAEHLWIWDRPKREARVLRRREEARAAAAALGIEPVGFSDWSSRTLKLYLGEALVWIDRVLNEYEIDEIWVSAWEGGHQDHDVANFLAAHAAGGRPVTEFAEYSSGKGKVMWQLFAQSNGSETVTRLTPEETEEKRRLLALYRSEKFGLGMVRLECESYRPLPPHDYSRPPHAGRLSREMYHWAGRFLPHPRVDFEPSAKIYETLRGFKPS